MSKLKPMARFEVPPVRRRPPSSATPRMDRKIESLATRMFLGLYVALSDEFRRDWIEAELAVRVWKDNARFAKQL